MHSVSSEPYYYESAYDFDFEPGVMVADSCGQCYYKDMNLPKAVTFFTDYKYSYHLTLTFIIHNKYTSTLYLLTYMHIYYDLL